MNKSRMAVLVAAGLAASLVLTSCSGLRNKDLTPIQRVTTICDGAAQVYRPVQISIEQAVLSPAVGATAKKEMKAADKDATAALSDCLVAVERGDASASALAVQAVSTATRTALSIMSRFVKEDTNDEQRNAGGGGDHNAGGGNRDACDSGGCRPRGEASLGRTGDAGRSARDRR